jgi:hypothetical protein
LWLLFFSPRDECLATGHPKGKGRLVLSFLRHLCVPCGYYAVSFAAISHLEVPDESQTTGQIKSVWSLPSFAVFAFLVAIMQFLSRLFLPQAQIFLAKPSLAHSFPALYAKGDCKTQNEESSGETL